MLATRLELPFLGTIGSNVPELAGCACALRRH